MPLRRPSRSTRLPDTSTPIESVRRHPTAATPCPTTHPRRETMHERSHTTGHRESRRTSSCRTGTKRSSRAGSSASPRVNGGSSESSPRSRPPPPLRFGFESGGAPEGPKLAHRLGASHFRSERRSEEHTSELQSLRHLVCRLLLEKKKRK